MWILTLEAEESPEFIMYYEHQNDLLKMTKTSLVNENIFYITEYHIVSNTDGFCYLFSHFQRSGETFNLCGLEERSIPAWILVCVCSIIFFCELLSEKEC